MTRRRRALLLAVLGIGLGALAAADVRRREAALERRIGPLSAVVVARGPVPQGAVLSSARLAVRSVPVRYAPAGAFASPDELAGLRAAVAIPAGADLVAGMVDDGAQDRAAGPPVRAGERVADLVATGSPQLIQPGARVDVVVTRDGNGSSGGAELALQDIAVLSSSAAPPGPGGDGARRVAVSLRVTLRQAVYLAAAQAFATEIRLLPRAPGDDRRSSERLSTGSELGT